MKKKYYDLPADNLILDILLIVSKYETKELSSPHLIKKLELNEKQIDFIFNQDEDEAFEDALAIKDQLLKLEGKSVPAKIDKDLKFIKKSANTQFASSLIMIFLLIVVILLSIFDTEGRSEGNIQMFRFLGIPLMVLVALFIMSRDFLFQIMYQRLKIDLKEQSLKERTLKNIIKIKPLKQNLNRGSEVGLIIYNREDDGKVIKYYLIESDQILFGTFQKDAYKDRNLQIQYYEKSKVITNTKYKEIIKRVWK